MLGPSNAFMKLKSNCSTHHLHLKGLEYYLKKYYLGSNKLHTLPVATAVGNWSQVTLVLSLDPQLGRRDEIFLTMSSCFENVRKLALHVYISMSIGH